jgi:hypothetical protein
MNKKATSGTNGKKSHNAFKQDVAMLPPPKPPGKKAIKKNIQLQMPVQNQDFIDNRELLRVLTEVRNGNFSARMPFDQVGLSGKVCDTLNEIISLNEKMMLEFTRAGHIIGKQGKLNQRIEVPKAKGAWSTGVDSLNVLISDLVHPTIEIAHVISWRSAVIHFKANSHRSPKK